MKRAGLITTLYLDMGGVLLTNGWDHLLHTDYKSTAKALASWGLANDAGAKPVGVRALKKIKGGSPSTRT